VRSSPVFHTQVIDRLLFGGLAARKEGVSHDLAGLAPGGIAAGPEVRQVIGAARLTHSTAGVATSGPPVAQPPYIIEEG
jgi:hypothetical protein